MSKDKSKIEKKLDLVRSAQVRKVGKCEYCGKTKYLNAHHIFGRKKLSTRWNIDNGICLCAGCHTFSSNFSAHQTPTEFTEWVKEYRGIEWYDRLRLEAYKPHQWTLEELENHLHYLKNANDK